MYAVRLRGYRGLKCRQSSISTGDYLQRLDSITSATIEAIKAAQQVQTGASDLTLAIQLSSEEALTTHLSLPLGQPVTLPQLQRLRRQYITLNKQTRGELPSAQTAQLFVDYLAGALK
jgi:tRNA uridine 5-carbamoylmethylation protein Kti12